MNFKVKGDDYLPIIAVHGGAWAIPEDLWQQSIEGVKAAALVGLDVSIE